MPKLYEPDLANEPLSDVVDAGAYTLEVEAWKFIFKKENPHKETQDPDEQAQYNDGVSLTTVILSGPGQGDTGWDPAGKKVFIRLNRPNKGMKDGGKFSRRRIKEVVLGCGLTVDADDGWDPDDLIGRSFECVLKVQPGQDGYPPKNDINYVIIPGAESAEG